MIKYFNSRLKLLTIWDFKLIQIATICFAIVLIKIFPKIIELPLGAYILIGFLFAIRPVYIMFWGRKN